jgi:hypothetical protein
MESLITALIVVFALIGLGIGCEAEVIEQAALTQMLAEPPPAACW